MGRDDIATAYIGQLQQAQMDLQKTGQQLEHATLASKQALKARDNYVLQMQRRTAEAMQLINQSKQAKLQEQLAQTMESFQIGDDASTFNEMRDKIDRRAAAAEASQLGAASVDTRCGPRKRGQDIALQQTARYKRDIVPSFRYPAAPSITPEGKLGTITPQGNHVLESTGIRQWFVSNASSLWLSFSKFDLVI